MTQPPGEDPPGVVSQKLIEKLQRRRDAEDSTQAVKAMGDILESIEARQRAQVAMMLLALSEVLNRLNLIIVNHEQETSPYANDLEKNCLSYLELLQKIYIKCAPEDSDTAETKRVKLDRNKQIFGLYARTLDLLLMYTRVDETRSKEKLTKLLKIPAIQRFVPQAFVKDIIDDLFSEPPKVVSMQ